MSDSQSAVNNSPAPYKLEKILNFRDVGATINHLTNTRILKEGVLFRSALPDNASNSDRSYLTNDLGIKTVIDLRSKTEHINQVKKLDPSISSSAVIPQSDSAITDPLKLLSVQYSLINLNGGSFERALLWKLSWASISKLLFLMALGYRTQAISILGSQVMAPRGLTGLGIDTLHHSTHEISSVFNVLGSSDPTPYPLLVHCTQGKDRTGLIILLVLMLAGVDLQAISADYRMSEAELEPDMEERMREIESIGLSEEFAGCPEGFVEAVASHIEKDYSGVRQYLEGIGVGKQTQQKVLDAVLSDGEG